MNIEGGIGGDFLKGGLSAGLAYYYSGKLTQDHIEGFPDILIRGKNKVFAIGPEVSLALAKGNTVYGFLKVNYEWEVYARTTTQGSEFQIAATFLVPSLKVLKPCCNSRSAKRSVHRAISASRFAAAVGLRSLR